MEIDEGELDRLAEEMVEAVPEDATEDAKANRLEQLGKAKAKLRTAKLVAKPDKAGRRQGAANK